jgi:hypothetical protein
LNAASGKNDRSLVAAFGHDVTVRQADLALLLHEHLADRGHHRDVRSRARRLDAPGVACGSDGQRLAIG